MFALEGVNDGRECGSDSRVGDSDWGGVSVNADGAVGFTW